MDWWHSSIEVGLDIFLHFKDTGRCMFVLDGAELGTGLITFDIYILLDIDDSIDGNTLGSA